MRNHIIVALAAGCSVLPSAAYAQDDSPFAGPRVEILGGYDTLRSGSSTDSDVGDDDLFDDDGPDESIDGIAYGLGLGYDFDLGGAVVGIEGEFMESTGEQDSDEMVSAPFGYRVDVSRDIYLGGRIGYKVAPRTLIYGKGGYSSTRVEAAFEDQIDDDGVDYQLDTDRSVDGYRIGAGVEQAIGSNAFAKLEYRYSNYDDLSFDDEVFAEDTVDIDLDRHQVVAGVGIRF
jgi:outer membrane immunogenic protein